MLTIVTAVGPLGQVRALQPLRGASSCPWYPRQVRIGILSDTHLAGLQSLDELGPQAAAFLATVDLVLHSGDVTQPSVLDWCAQFAEVRCARGGNDHFADPRMQPIVVLQYLGWRIGMVHDVEAIPSTIDTVHDLKARVYQDAGLDILISGDSHYERLEYKDRTLLLDSGSPSFPHHRSTRLGSVALLELTRDGVRADILALGETPGAPNPCTPAWAEFDRGGLRGAAIGGRAMDASAGAVRWRPSAAPPLRV